MRHADIYMLIIITLLIGGIFTFLGWVIIVKMQEIC